MVEEYLLWKRMEDECRRQIQQAEDMLYMNKMLLLTAKKHLRQLPKPKNDTRQVAKGSP